MPASAHRRHDANPPGAPRPPQGPPRRAPRLPTPRLLAPRLPAPRLPAPHLPARCLPRLHRLVACRIRTREACRPASATPPPASLLACAKRCDSAPSRSPLPPCPSGMTRPSPPGAAQLQPAQPIAAPWPRSYTQPGEELEPGPDLSSPNPLLHDGCRLPLRQTSSVYDNTV